MKKHQLSAHEAEMVERGFARQLADGRVIPVMRGGDPAADPIFPAALEDLETATDEQLAEFVEASLAAATAVGADPDAYTNDERDMPALFAEMTAGVEALEAARAGLAARAEDADTEVETAEVEAESEELAAGVAELAARAAAPPAVVEPPVVPPAEVVVAAAPPAVVQPPRPARSSRATPQVEEAQMIALTASIEGFGHAIGEEIDIEQAAAMMIRRRGQFGNIPQGTSGEKIAIARASWSHLYPVERRLGASIETNMALIASACSPSVFKDEMRRRRNLAPEKTLTASGGLCAPVTPYYQLMMISQAMRPVRGALPSFNADRGGIRFAAPASLAAITTGIGIRTAANDFAGGTEGAKTCQVIACPAFSEADVAIIFHCLQFGNLGNRTFPELVAQWNQLTLAAHARLAETALLTSIDASSTAVTAQSLGLGATGALLGQVLAAANGMRSRHRMDPEAVLRVMMPDWAIDLMVSDVIRGQFQRFDTDEAKITALLRSFDIEPTFYIDGATGAGQVFGTQTAGALLPFPSTVRWYLFPEGTHLYLDGGTLELGLVRDSVLNATNDFQLFGETFENTANVGVESLAVTSTICDSGTVALPHAVPCPIDYTHTS